MLGSTFDIISLILLALGSSFQQPCTVGHQALLCVTRFAVETTQLVRLRPRSCRVHPSWWHLLPSGQHGPARRLQDKPLGSGVSGIGQSPSKRRRLNDELDDGDEADVISLSVCSRHRDEEQEGDIFVSLVFCWSKTIVLYDAEMLFEVHRILSGTGPARVPCPLGRCCSSST